MPAGMVAGRPLFRGKSCKKITYALSLAFCGCRLRTTRRAQLPQPFLGPARLRASPRLSRTISRSDASWRAALLHSCHTSKYAPSWRLARRAPRRDLRPTQPFEGPHGSNVQGPRAGHITYLGVGVIKSAKRFEIPVTTDIPNRVSRGGRFSSASSNCSDSAIPNTKAAFMETTMIDINPTASRSRRTVWLGVMDGGSRIVQHSGFHH